MGNSSLKSFMACVQDDIRDREAEEFGQGLDSNVSWEEGWYLHGCCDEGARLLLV